jgi:DNA polymerase I-like protein with 3'-5' exonuclease and polymerase domains
LLGALLARQVLDDCRRDGYVTTLAGRRRPLPNINSNQWSERSEAERQAINSVCQGSAADLVKRAMLQLAAEMRGAGLEQHCKMVLQVGGCLAWLAAWLAGWLAGYRISTRFS